MHVPTSLHFYFEKLATPKLVFSQAVHEQSNCFRGNSDRPGREDPIIPVELAESRGQKRQLTVSLFPAFAVFALQGRVEIVRDHDSWRCHEAVCDFGDQSQPSVEGQ